MHCVGYYGRTNVHCFNLAYGNHLGRSVLFYSLPAPLPAHEISILRRRKDSVRLDCLYRDMFVPGTGGASQPFKRVPRRPLCSSRAAIRHLWIDLCFLRTAAGYVHNLRADREDTIA